MELDEDDKAHKKRKRVNGEDFSKVEERNKHYFAKFDENMKDIMRSGLFSPFKLRFIKKLGEGTFCRVLLVRDKIKNDYYVLKIASKAKMLSSKSKKNTLLIEYNLLKGMETCAGVPKVFDIYHDDDYAYLLEEYIQGTTLFDWFSGKEGTLSEFDIFCIFHSLVTIVKDVHNRAVIHHDIKCENIMIMESQKKVLLIDFGLSEVIEDIKSPYCICSAGSIEYMIPEKICYGPKDKRKPYNGFHSDLYSIGVVLFCLVFGRFPYSREEIFERIKKKDFKYPMFKKKEIRKVSDELLDFAIGLVAFNPKQRMTFSDLEKHPWYIYNQKLWTSAMAAHSKSEV